MTQHIFVTNDDREVRLANGMQAFASDGAPSDCVALATLGFFNEPVDLVVSGINAGANLGHDVTCSGTVTAAMETVIAGVPGIAVSLETMDSHIGETDYGPAPRLAGRVVRHVIENRLSREILLNVPFPPENKMRGILLTRQGQRVYHSRLDERIDPRGHSYYWIGGDAPAGVPEQGTDVGALAEGFVSVTPLQLDLTIYRTVTELNTWHWDDEPNTHQAPQILFSDQPLKLKENAWTGGSNAANLFWNLHCTGPAHISFCLGSHCQNATI